MKGVRAITMSARRLEPGDRLLVDRRGVTAQINEREGVRIATVEYAESYQSEADGRPRSLRVGLDSGGREQILWPTDTVWLVIREPGERGRDS